MFGRKKMKTKIGNLSGHCIIAGFGRVGQQVAQEFSRRDVDFVVIERDEGPLKRLIERGYLFIEGEATKDETLQAAGIEQARTLISTLPDEAQNVYLTLSARDINKELKIIARADFEGGEKKLMRAGANHVVSPHVIGGQRMAMASLRPNVVDFMHMTSIGKEGLSIEEIVIPVGSKLAGKTVIESSLKENYGVTIVGIRRPSGEFDITPGPRTMLSETDTMVVIGPNEGLERLAKSLNH
jgi:voltage-gated potassium channel